MSWSTTGKSLSSVNSIVIVIHPPTGASREIQGRSRWLSGRDSAELFYFVHHRLNIASLNFPCGRSSPSVWTLFENRKLCFYQSRLHLLALCLTFDSANIDWLPITSCKITVPQRRYSTVKFSEKTFTDDRYTCYPTSLNGLDDLRKASTHAWRSRSYDLPCDKSPTGQTQNLYSWSRSSIRRWSSDLFPGTRPRFKYTIDLVDARPTRDAPPGGWNLQDLSNSYSIFATGHAQCASVLVPFLHSLSSSPVIWHPGLSCRRFKSWPQECLLT